MGSTPLKELNHSSSHPDHTLSTMTAPFLSSPKKLVNWLTWTKKQPPRPLLPLKVLPTLVMPKPKSKSMSLPPLSPPSNSKVQYIYYRKNRFKFMNKDKSFLLFLDFPFVLIYDKFLE